MDLYGVGIVYELPDEVLDELLHDVCPLDVPVSSASVELVPQLISGSDSCIPLGDGLRNQFPCELLAHEVLLVR